MFFDFDCLVFMLFYGLYRSILVVVEGVDADRAEVATTREVLIVIEGIPLTFELDNRAVACVAACRLKVDAFVFPRTHGGGSHGVVEAVSAASVLDMVVGV